MLVLIGAAVVGVLTPAAAGAAVSSSSSLTVPNVVAVGQTGVPGSFTVRNTNSAPNQAESNTVTSLRLAVGCGAVTAPPNPCPTPDLGIATVASPATGAPATACAGVTFTVSAPDASGVVTFTPSSPVVLAPPGGAAGSDLCTVNFTFSVLRTTNIDADAAPGIQTWVNLRTVSQSPGGLMPANNPSNKITVNRGLPTITTQVSPSVAVGGSVFDTATVTGLAGIAAPTGTVTFNLYGPNDATCSGASLATSTVAIAGGTAQSSPTTVTQAGTYRYVATYNGDSNYTSRSNSCGEPSETVVVTGTTRARPADFDGNGTTDVSVFRPSSGAWLVKDQATVFLGLNGDKPVPCDYTGDGRTDRAVFRPSTGAWFIEGQATVFLGLSTDIPVPADYNGDGRCEVAVFRPSVGAWHISGMTTTYFGLNGDVPVPADYDGNGSADIAVFRPSVGAWYRIGAGTTFFGANGDIPVPGDYDGNGTADIAVFRPSVGGWYQAVGTTTFFGANGDIPVPGDYDGNLTTDIAVYRPSVGGWYRSGAATVFHGAPGDIPLPLPEAIRSSV